MSNLKEETLHSEQLLDGHLLKVYRDEVRLPDGQSSVREWIDHPGASAVIPLFTDGSTILVRQYRYASRRTFLEVPAGKMDVVGEDPEEVANRELEEETGWKAGRLTHLDAAYPCIGYSNEVIHFFLAEELTDGTVNLSEGEFIEQVRLPLEEAVEMARRGEIEDMKTITALFLADTFLRRRRQQT